MMILDPRMGFEGFVTDFGPFLRILVDLANFGSQQRQMSTYALTMYRKVMEIDDTSYKVGKCSGIGFDS